jgi:general secretion pathway protein A
MYLTFYGLHKNPFHTTPDPDFLYLSPSHKQALGSIIYGIQEKKGFVAVTGEVGLGKTTVLRSYLSHVDNGHNELIYLLNPNLSFIDLLKTVLGELKQDHIGGDEPQLVSQLHQILIEQYRKGRPVLLIIDEAQNIPVATLESLRMLSNLETSKDKLIQIVLVGQPELADLLNRHELRQLNQRIAVRATIVPLAKNESYAYIRHRLAKAGSKGKKLFTNRALSLIVREAKGNPRRLNILCDNAFVTGLGYRKRPVTAGIAKEVIADLNGSTSRISWKWVHAAGSLLLIVVLAGLLLWERQDTWGSLPLTTLEEFVHQSSETIKKYLFGDERKAEAKEYGQLRITHVLDVPSPPRPPQLPPVPQPPRPPGIESIQGIKA